MWFLLYPRVGDPFSRILYSPLYIVKDKNRNQIFLIDNHVCEQTILHWTDPQSTLRNEKGGLIKH